MLFPIEAKAHPGRTDANGGHWDHSNGTYHYHDGSSSGKSSSSSGSSYTSRYLSEQYKDGYETGYDEGYKDGTSDGYAAAEKELKEAEKEAVSSAKRTAYTTSAIFTAAIIIASKLFKLRNKPAEKETILDWMDRKLKDKSTPAWLGALIVTLPGFGIIGITVLILYLLSIIF